MPAFRPRADLRARLDALYAGYNATHSVNDPIWVVRRFTRPEDQEVVAFCAAALAFGRVQSVMNAIAGLLAAMGPSPADYVRAFEPSARRSLDHLVHRWTRGVDLAALVWVLRRMLDEAGSIEGYFARGLEPDAVTVESALESFSARALAVSVREIYGRARPSPGVAYFFPRPSGGGACKRLNLFLRWMVRRDEVDLGVWTRVSPAQLIVPLDTHVIRVGRCLGLTRYASPGWRMAADITSSLRALDAADPVRYDFALCHVGMMGACGFGRPRGDAHCPLKGACRPARAAVRGTS
ncbi:MAG: TIGR02757 family protein [Acidobacteriota bacterium]